MMTTKNHPCIGDWLVNNNPLKPEARLYDTYAQMVGRYNGDPVFRVIGSDECVIYSAEELEHHDYNSNGVYWKVAN